MAKRKLSPEQRVTIRKEIKSRLATGEEQAQVLKAVSGKYHITTETARWYMKSPGGVAARNGKPTKRQARKNKPPKTPGGRRHAPRSSRRRAAARRQARRMSVTGVASALASSIKRAAEKAIRRVSALKKLMPKLNAQIRLEARLRAKEYQVRKALSPVQAKLKRLQREVSRLTT